MENKSFQLNDNRFFVAYELGEALFNKFQSLSGEIGIKLHNDQMCRIAHINLKLTEEHLSSDFASAVEGNNVEGKQFGFEAFYDFPIFIQGLYLGPSIGFYRHTYSHTILDERLEKSSITVGSAISFREVNLFQVTGLYYKLSIPARLTLAPIQQSQLGDTTIKNNTFDNSIWLFIGYEF